MLISADSNTVCSWTNGRKANVYLIENGRGRKVILKRYSARFFVTMFREYFLTSYLSRRLDVIPEVLEFNPLRREIVFSYIEGERLLEWVLSRYGKGDYNLEDFHSFNDLSTNTVVVQAFKNFRNSRSSEANQLRRAITESYEMLHKTGFVHGSADPRNIIYNGEHAFIIDFDHSRPSPNPRRIDYQILKEWYGISS